MRPASHPTAGDSIPPRPDPETVLLDTVAYIDDEANATTAYGARSDGQSEIQVTFWIAHPPRASYFTVHCPGLKPDAFRKLPRVVATEDGLALLRVPVSPEHNLQEEEEEERVNEFFIYCARTGNQLKQPTLRLLPNPDPRYYADNEVGILNCRRTDDSFFLVVLHRNPLTTPETRYIHMFDSETWKWETKPVSPPESYSYHITDKVFTIGGRYGAMGWVDLWLGIFIYDVILGGNTIDYKALPSSGVLPTLQGLGSTVRDIVVVNGFIKYFCMYSPGVDTTNVSGDWLAYAWRMKYPLQQDWQQDCHLKASEIMDNHKHSERRLKDKPDGVEKPALMLRAGSPVLSLHDVDVVYILTKPMYSDEMAWVHAVNMCTKTIHGIAEFGAERTVGFMFHYTQSRIFKPKAIEVKEDNHKNEEDSWTYVSRKKKKNDAPAGARQGLPSQEEMHIILAWAREDTRWAQTMDAALALWVDEVASGGQGHIMAREEEGMYRKIDGTSHDCDDRNLQYFDLHCIDLHYTDPTVYIKPNNYVKPYDYANIYVEFYIVKVYINMVFIDNFVNTAELFAVATCASVGDGKTASFWKDSWVDGGAPFLIAPNLFKASRRKCRSVAEALNDGKWILDLRGRVTADSLSEFLDLWDQVRRVALVQGTFDSLVWRFSEDGIYSSKSTYRLQFRLQFLGATSSPFVKLIWSATAAPKRRFFGWLFAQNRLLTADRLLARRWPNSYFCPLCRRSLETALHLLVECPWARRA
ncbi:hypothetical protein QYE76_033119 [Lolium multiflorum]|uniref:Reverse transcriptase zinc-binding domain-containing protein n=1 Tax=Lolium multiflorum TaxID=4521 RepID=A0AAD8QWG7_LOLMU|nr:hypothetical protein QYE76_033119 [Lolium multiflorum]